MWAVLAKELSSVSSAHRLLGTTCDPSSGDEASSGPCTHEHIMPAPTQNTNKYSLLESTRQTWREGSVGRSTCCTPSVRHAAATSEGSQPPATPGDSVVPAVIHTGGIHRHRNKNRSKKNVIENKRSKQGSDSGLIKWGWETCRGRELSAERGIPSARCLRLS